MSLHNIATRAARSADSPLQFLTGRVVRTDSDADIARKGTVSVLTDNGTLFRDVLVTYDSRFSYSLPDTPKESTTIGSLVIIGFLNANFQNPFIVKYIKDATLPSPAVPKNYFQWSNGDLIFTSDGYGVSSLMFLQEVQNMTITFTNGKALLQFASPGTLDVKSKYWNIEGTDIRKAFVTVTEKFEEHTYTTKKYTSKVTEKLESEIKESEIKITDKHTEEIEEMSQKIKKLETEIDELKGTIKKLEIKSNSAILDCKNISLSSSSPSDAPVLYNQLNNILTQLCTALSTLTVTCTAPGSPSSPPLNFAIFQSISSSLTILKSKYIKID